AFWLFVLVWVMQTMSIIYEFIATKTFPFMSLYEGVYFYAWILLTFTLLINLMYQVHHIVLLKNVFTFFMMALSILLNAKQQSIGRSNQLIHELLMAHITFSILSYAFFTMSFLLATMYLIQYYLLKQKKCLKSIWRFTNLAKINTYFYYVFVICSPYLSGVYFFWFDFKTIGFILFLVIYSLYLILHHDTKFHGKSVSIYSSATFLMLLVNFFLFSTLSNFHF